MAKKKSGLRYIGDGSMWMQTINGRMSPVPPRDLTPEQVERRGRRELLASGLYAEFAGTEEPLEEEQEELDNGS